MGKFNTKTTFKQFAQHWVKIHMNGRSTEQVQRAERTLLRHLVRIGNVPLKQVTEFSLARELKDIASEHSYDTANRARQMLVRIFKHAIELGLVDSNPAKTLKTPDICRRGRKPKSNIDLNGLRSILLELEESESGRDVRAAVKLSILLFQRTAHIQNMRWKDITFHWQSGMGVWNIPANQTLMKREHQVPIANHAFEVLSDLIDYAGDNEFVFPSRNNPNRGISNNTTRKAAMDMGWDGFCSRNVRSTVKKHYLEEGGDKIFIDALMGLTPSEELAQYALGWDAMAHGVMDWWEKEVIYDAGSRSLPRSVLVDPESFYAW